MIGVFGSFARGENTDHSDVDILFSPQIDIGLFKLAKIQEELEKLLKKQVDLVTEGGLNPILASKIYQDLKIIYES